jgi:hypothetical protein
MSLKKTVKIGEHSFIIKRWNYGEKQKALREVTTWSKDPTSGDTIPDIDPWKINDMMILSCLVSWDLKDEKGVSIPITIASIHGVEPAELVEKLLEEIQILNGVTEGTRKK